VRSCAFLGCEELETCFGKSNCCVMKQKKEFHSIERASQLRGRQKFKSASTTKHRCHNRKKRLCIQSGNTGVVWAFGQERLLS